MRLVVENEGGETAEATVAGAFNVHPFATFAATDGASVYPYDTREKAATNVFDALNAIWNGETEQARSLTIAAGAYALAETIPLSRAVTVRGAGIDATVLTGTNLNKRAFLVAHPDAVVEDLTILGVSSAISPGGAVRLTGGTVRRVRIADAKGTINSFEGVAVSMAGGRLEDSVIEGNRATSLQGYNSCGAGVRMTGAFVSDLTILGVRSATTPGGAVRLESGTMSRIRIADGQSTVYNHEGMGISLAGGCLEDSIVEGNRQPPTDGYNCRGAGVHMTGGLVSRCLIRGNGAGSTHDAYRGGSGIYMTGGTVDCTRVTGNIGGHGNGGVAISGGLLRNCLLDGNTGTGAGAALLVSGSGAKVYNCTVVTNLGGVAASASAGTVANAIFWGNPAGDLSFSDLATVRNCDWSENTSPRNGNLSADPLFKRPLSSD